jgi:hypothetical protein
MQKIIDSRGELLKRLTQTTKSVYLMISVFFIISAFAIFFLKLPISLNILYVQIIWVFSSFAFLIIANKESDVEKINNYHLCWMIIEILYLTVIVHYLGSIAWIAPVFYFFFAAYKNFIFGEKKRRIMFYALIFFIFVACSFGIFPNYSSL